jgi:hypothetical protein
MLATRSRCHARPQRLHLDEIPQAGQWPATTVARTVFRGDYAGLGSAWSGLSIRRGPICGSVISLVLSRGLIRPVGARNSIGRSSTRFDKRIPMGMVQPKISSGAEEDAEKTMIVVYKKARGYRS